MEPAQGNAREVQARKVLIVMDDREARSEVLQVLQQSPDVELCIRRLKSGDYWVADQCLIERKTIPDFAASIIDGRLFRQSWLMTSRQTASALILEGTSQDLEKIQLSRAAIQGTMVSLALVYHLPVLRSLGPAETGRLLVYAGHQLMRSCQPWVLYARRRARTRRGRQLRVLQSFPGVGPERAELLLEKFGSLRAVVNAEPEQLESITGIGPKISSRILELIR